MDEFCDFDTVARRSIYANTIGGQVLEYLKYFDPQLLAGEVESNALALVESIRLILEDLTLDDPACFSRIEAIINAYDAAGIHVSQHDW